MTLPRFLLCVWCAIWAGSATAHEFWIEAVSYQVETGEELVANLKNGETFEGTTLSYFPRDFSRFEIIQNNSVQPVEARLGDRPALNVTVPGDGLVSVVYEATPSFVTYREWEKFTRFADHKDFPNIAARHASNGFPDVPFKERYTRHAKALIAVGAGQGADRAVGLKTEFVALTNPYDKGFDGTMRVQVLRDGTPRADAQVEVFDRPIDGEVEVTFYRTDTDGIAAIPVTAGHTYLFDAVVLEPIKGDDNAVWDTFWAALTFAVPG